jgi:hypothetical protein
LERAQVAEQLLVEQQHLLAFR